MENLEKAYKSVKANNGEACPLISMALPNEWFNELGLINLERYNVGIITTDNSD